MRNAIVLIVATILLVAASLFVKNKMGSRPEIDLFDKMATSTDTKSLGLVEPKGTTTDAAINTPKSTTIVTPRPSMTKEGNYIIYYDNSGFSPGTLTITAGKGIRFINNSSRAMLIYAADQNDPVAASLNQSKSAFKGGIYNYTFTKPGVYKYYNYNNPKDIGVVEVKPQ